MNIGYNPHLGYEEDVLVDYDNMVHSIANKYRGSINSGFDYEDLVSVGRVALLEAFRNYDPDRFDGTVTTFSTYAFPMIRWGILRYLRDARHLVRVPRSIQNKLTLIRKQGWEQETAENISEMSGWDITEVREVKLNLEGSLVVSLNQTLPSYGDRKELTLLDSIPTQVDFTGVAVQEFFTYLSHVEQKVLRLRLRDSTQKEIARHIGKTQAQVSRMLSQIGTKYRQFQTGDLEKKGVINMSKLQSKTVIEWFMDEGVSTNPTVSLNGQGIHFNRRAVHQIGCKAGQCIQVGFDSEKGMLLLRMEKNGLQLRMASGDKSGGLRLVNKRLASWLLKKKLPLKRYALHTDPNNDFHFILLDRDA